MPLPIQLLGPTAIAGRPVEMPPRARAFLTSLALRPGHVVSMERLATLVWANPPEAYLSNLRTYATYLRRGLASTELENRLETHRAAGGYRLCLGSESIDALRFSSLSASGRAALRDGRLDESIHLLQQGLELWRGEVVEDLPEVGELRADLDELDEARHAAETDLGDALLACGLVDEAVLVLRRAVRHRSYADRPVELLMRAHYVLGDSARALAVFRRHSQRLTEDLALRPQPSLFDLYQAILCHNVTT